MSNQLIMRIAGNKATFDVKWTEQVTVEHVAGEDMMIANDPDTLPGAEDIKAFSRSLSSLSPDMAEMAVRQLNNIVGAELVGEPMGDDVITDVTFRVEEV